MSLDPNIIKKSFFAAGPHLAEIIKNFYEILFERYPESKQLFKDVNMSKQRKILAKSLEYIVDHLEDSDELVNYLENMGGRHLKYGTQEAHYDLVGECLLAAFEKVLKKDWTDQLKEQWTLAYGIIAETMIQGARKQKSQSKDHLSVVKNQVAENSTQGAEIVSIISFNKNLQVQLPEELEEAIKQEAKKQFHKKVNEIFNQTIEDEINQYVDHLRKAA